MMDKRGTWCLWPCATWFISVDINDDDDDVHDLKLFVNEGAAVGEVRPSLPIAYK